MRYFVVGVEQGPFPCEYPGCNESTYTIRLTDEENEKLPEKTGAKAAQFIFKHNMGKAVCYKHR